MNIKICLLFWLLATSAAFAQKQVVVAANGSGNFRTVQAARDAVPKDNKLPYIVFIRKGVYKEKLNIEAKHQ